MEGCSDLIATGGMIGSVLSRKVWCRTAPANCGAISPVRNPMLNGGLPQESVKVQTCEEIAHDYQEAKDQTSDYVRMISRASATS